MTVTPPTASGRIASVDALRGLTILLMVFVNDLGPAAPAWLHHIQPADADGMTLADIVFPFFLFIAGVSVPLSMHAARQRGSATPQILGHILLRTSALLTMGLIAVNRSAETVLGPALWGLLAYMACICTWSVAPRDTGVRRTMMQVVKFAGVLGLLALLAVYRREPVETTVLFRGTVTDWVWLKTSWWGILGLIAWAWLLTAVTYLLVGNRREFLLAAVGLCMLNFLVARHGGFFARTADKSWLAGAQPVLDLMEQFVAGVNSYVDLGTQLGSLPAITMSGCVLGTILLPDSDTASARQRIRWALIYASGLFLAGAMTDTFAGINKIAATPTWCFWCAALATLTWLFLYVLMDVFQFTKWSILIRPAGANPLLAFLLHPIILFVLQLTQSGGTLRAYAAADSAAVVLAGSFGMAVVVCALTSLLGRLGLRMRV